MSQPLATAHSDTPAGLEQGRWQIAPWFILRTAGFPVDLMRELHFSATERQIDALLAAEASLGTLPPDLLAVAQTTFEAELDTQAQRLRKLAGSTAFREAVFLSNPAQFPLIARWIDGYPQSPSKFRQGLLTVMLYLQRFCMKNDTTSFFGPFCWGRFAPDQAENLRYTPGAVRRTTFFAHWAAQLVATWASQFPAAAAVIRPRQVPTLALIDGRVQGLHPDDGRWRAIDTPVDLPPYAADLLALIDGERTLDDLLTIGSQRWQQPPSEVRAVIDRLATAQLIHAQIELPVGPTEPLAWLRAELARAQVAEALPVVDQLIALQSAFATANLTERQRLLARMSDLFAATTGSSTTRGAGRHYADRSLVYEDAVRDLADLDVGGQLLRDLAQLATLWELLWVVHERDQQYTQQTSTAWFHERFAGRDRVTFLDYARAWLSDEPTLAEAFRHNDRRVQALLDELFTSLIPPDAVQQRVIRLIFDDVQRIIERLGVVNTDGAIVNPDWMLLTPSLDALNAGQYRLVLGEVHTAVDLLSHTPLTYALPATERESLRRFVSDRYAALAAPDEWIVDVIRLHLRKTSAQLTLDAPQIEAQGRSPKDRRAVARLADLEVRLENDRLRLYAPGWRQYLRLTSMRVPNGNASQANLLRPFALTEQEGVIPMPQAIRYHPRVEVGRIVLLRRSWRVHYHDWYDLSAAQPGWSLHLWLHAARLRKALDLPDRIFAKIAGETKPVYVDFGNYFLIHAFTKLWQKHQGVAVLSEACPDASDAWLHDEHGRYSCEFRMGFYRRRAHNGA